MLSLYDEYLHWVELLFLFLHFFIGMFDCWLVLLQWDFGNGYPHQQNNAGTCNHPKVSQLFIVYVHHSPKFRTKLVEHGHGLSAEAEKCEHITDVWTFWGEAPGKPGWKKPRRGEY